MIKTSVIVPVYNVAPYLEDCLTSIRRQTQKEIEIIAVDDGSTDNSLAILHHIQQNESRLRIITQKNHGLGYTRNVGIEHARGEYIYFIDADDCLNDLNALEQCYRCAKKENLDVVLFDAAAFGDDELIMKNSYDRKGILPENALMSGLEMIHMAYARDSFVVSACLLYVSIKFLKYWNLRFPVNVLYEDTSFYCRLMSEAKRVMYLPCRYYRRRYRKESITTNPVTLVNCESRCKIATLIYKIYEENQDLQHDIFRELAFEVLVAGLKQGFQLNESVKTEKIKQNMWKKILEICTEGEMPDCYLYPNKFFYLVYWLGKHHFDTGLTDKAKDWYKELFSDIPLHQKGKIVGIYGTGHYTDDFFEVYEKCIGIKAEVFFIDSYKTSGTEEYRGCKIYNVADIQPLHPDCVLVSSRAYESEMCRMLKEKCAETFQVVRLKGDLRF